MIMRMVRIFKNDADEQHDATVVGFVKVDLLNLRAFNTTPEEYWSSVKKTIKEEWKEFCATYPAADSDFLEFLSRRGWNVVKPDDTQDLVLEER